MQPLYLIVIVSHPWLSVQLCAFYLYDQSLLRVSLSLSNHHIVLVCIFYCHSYLCLLLMGAIAAFGLKLDHPCSLPTRTCVSNKGSWLVSTNRESFKEYYRYTLFTVSGMGIYFKGLIGDRFKKILAGPKLAKTTHIRSHQKIRLYEQDLLCE